MEHPSLLRGPLIKEMVVRHECRLTAKAAMRSGCSEAILERWVGRLVKVEYFSRVREHESLYREQMFPGQTRGRTVGCSAIHFVCEAGEYVTAL